MRATWRRTSTASSESLHARDRSASLRDGVGARARDRARRRAAGSRVERRRGRALRRRRGAPHRPKAQPLGRGERAPCGRAGREEWSPRLVRSGAAQLNARYRDATKSPRDAAAWRAFAAVKRASEAVLRSDGTRAGTRSALRTTTFDAHVGVPLRVDA